MHRSELCLEVAVSSLEDDNISDVLFELFDKPGFCHLSLLSFMFEVIFQTANMVHVLLLVPLTIWVDLSTQSTTG